MSNSVQRMAKAGENIRKLGFAWQPFLQGCSSLLPRWLFT